MADEDDAEGAMGGGGGRKAPNGPDGRSNRLGPSKINLYKWSIVRPTLWTVHTHFRPSKLLIPVIMKSMGLK